MCIVYSKKKSCIEISVVTLDSFVKYKLGCISVKTSLIYTLLL